MLQRMASPSAIAPLQGPRVGPSSIVQSIQFNIDSIAHFIMNLVGCDLILAAKRSNGLKSKYKLEDVPLTHLPNPWDIPPLRQAFPTWEKVEADFVYDPSMKYRTAISVYFTICSMLHVNRRGLSFGTRNHKLNDIMKYTLIFSECDPVEMPNGCISKFD